MELLGLLRILSLPALGGRHAPNPIELGSLIAPEDVEVHRRIDCRSYDRCLDAAYRRHWRSFSCAACLVAAPACGETLDTAHAASLRPGA